MFIKSENFDEVGLISWLFEMLFDYCFQISRSM